MVFGFEAVAVVEHQLRGRGKDCIDLADACAGVDGGFAGGRNADGAWGAIDADFEAEDVERVGVEPGGTGERDGGGGGDGGGMEPR